MKRTQSPDLKPGAGEIRSPFKLQLQPQSTQELLASANRGTVMGFFSASGAVGMAIGYPVGGILFDRVGPPSPFVLFVGLNAVVFLSSLRVRRRVNAQSGTPGPSAPVTRPLSVTKATA